jgi:hypothetical protein
MLPLSFGQRFAERSSCEDSKKLDRQESKLDYQTHMIEELRETNYGLLEEPEKQSPAQRITEPEQLTPPQPDIQTRIPSTPIEDILTDPNIRAVDNRGKGLFWVVIGYSETKEGAVKQAKAARKQGFPQARANLPFKDNPFYGVSAGDHLRLSEAKGLLKRARECVPDAWVWQWHL